MNVSAPEAIFRPFKVHACRVKNARIISRGQKLPFINVNSPLFTFASPLIIAFNLSIADNGGLAEAFLAFTNSSSSEGPMKDLPTLPGLSQFSAEQLFFLSFGSMWCETKTFEALAMQLTGDVHPPHSVRISGAVKNSPEFAKAFKCKKADQMFLPEQKRCKIW